MVPNVVLMSYYVNFLIILGKIFITDVQNQEYDQTKLIEYVDDDENNSIIEQPQVFYINEDLSEYEFAGISDPFNENSGMTFETEIIDIDNLVKFGSDESSEIIYSPSG